LTTATRDDRPALDARLVRAGGLAEGDVIAPTPETFELPEKVVQFGTGAFLRGFVDFFIDAANRRGQFSGRVVAIGSTGSGRDVAFNTQDGLYTLIVEGREGSATIRERRIVASVSRALSATRDWRAVLSLAREPALELVFSNTTEVGITVVDGDVLDAAPPPSFPGKVARFLLERGRAFDYAAEAGVIVLPCELIERNGDRLRELVLSLASRWGVEAAFAEWIQRAVPFCNTLVDRIVPGKPDDQQRKALEQSAPYRDDLATVAEPYRLFAIEAPTSVRAKLTFAAADPGIILTDDVTPYRERKVRILNGGHTLIAPLGLLVGCETVRQAVEHQLLGPYLRNLLFDEIVPSLTVPNGRAFAREVIDRFGNPFLRHALVDITLQQTAKMRVRVVPSIVRAAERSGAVPAALAFGFAAYLLFIRRSMQGLTAGVDSDGERVRAIWSGFSGDTDAAFHRVAFDACADDALWHTNLCRVSGFVDLVAAELVRMNRLGVAAALDEHLTARSRFPGEVPPAIVNEP
jgi:tagaturonate reductase